jgi:hypothetical protein
MANGGPDAAKTAGREPRSVPFECTAALDDRCRSYVKQGMIIGAVPMTGAGILVMLVFERVA